MVQELLYWARIWKLDKNLCYKNASEAQLLLIRCNICRDLLNVHGFVVNTHFSKSCKLPVYYFELKNGIKVILRDNFHDWKLSVETPADQPNLPVNYLPEDCICGYKENGKYSKIDFVEGFKDEWIYGPYDPENPAKKFTIEVAEEYALYVIMHYLKHAYPDRVFDANADKRSIEQIEESIEYIMKHHSTHYDSEKKETVKVMSLWEIFSETNYAIHKAKIDGPYLCDEPWKYANVIYNNPEIHAVFLREEYEYLNVEEKF